MARKLTKLEKAGGEEFVQRAVGMKGSEIEEELKKLRDDQLASLIRFLEFEYDGPTWGFALTLHSLCQVEAAERFVKSNTTQS